MSEGPDLLERTKMALAEVIPGGESLVWWHESIPGAIGSPRHMGDDLWRAVWAATSLARFTPGGRAYCWHCTEASRHRGAGWQSAMDRCRAYLPLTEDCGVER